MQPMGERNRTSNHGSPLSGERFLFKWRKHRTIVARYGSNVICVSSMTGNPYRLQASWSCCINVATRQSTIDIAAKIAAMKKNASVPLNRLDSGVEFRAVFVVVFIRSVLESNGSDRIVPDSWRFKEHSSFLTFAIFDHSFKCLGSTFTCLFFDSTDQLCVRNASST